MLSDNSGVSDSTPDFLPECPRCVQLGKLVLELQSQVVELQSQAKLFIAEIRDLKSKLNTHSGNSSLPPSANPPGTPKFPPRPPTGRKPGGQPAHAEATEAVRTAPVKNADETGWSIAGQLCRAHLKRDFQKWLDRGGEGVSVGQGGLAAMKPVQEERQRTLETQQHCADKKVALFCGKILAVDQAMWTFTRIEGVEPTNNHAERTLRLAVIWRKISFGNHGEGGCRFAERILTVVQTLRLQKRNVMTYLEQALESTRANRPIPSLLPMGA